MFFLAGAPVSGRQGEQGPCGGPGLPNGAAQGGHSHKKHIGVGRYLPVFTKNVLRGGFSQKMSYAALAKTNTQHKNPQKIARFARQNLPGARFARHFAQKTHWLRQFAQKMFWPPRLRRASTKNFVGSDPPVPAMAPCWGPSRPPSGRCTLPRCHNTNPSTSVSLSPASLRFLCGAAATRRPIYIHMCAYTHIYIAIYIYPASVYHMHMRSEPKLSP